MRSYQDRPQLSSHQHSIDITCLQLIAEHAPMQLWTADADGKMDFINSRWDEFIEDSEDKLSDAAWKSIIHPADHERLRSAWNVSLQTGKVLEVEMRLRRLSDKKYVWILSRAWPVRDEHGEVVKWVGSNIDINERKLARIELEKTKQELVEANLAKNQFLANMSHEIRTPLGVIIGFADLALEAEKNHADAHDYLVAIKRNGQQLNHLIGEVLDLSKAETNKLEIQEANVPLQSLLNEVAHDAEERAQAKGLEFLYRPDSSLPDLVQTDPARLRQVLNNMLSNAIKFTGRGEVRFNARMTSPKLEGQPIRLEFSVFDTGIGIPEGRHSKLFTPFSNVDDSRIKSNGDTGMGLVLGQQMAKAMGGDLRLESSAPGKGSHFVLTIEAGLWQKSVMVTDPQLAKKIVSPQPEAELEGCRILLVEDSPDNQTLVTHYLMNTGATVEVANNGFEGVEKASRDDYDVILMDIQMPVMDGYQATKYIRQNGFNKPIIALTAHALRQEQERALNSGFNMFLTKPISRKVLLENLAKAV